MLDWFLKTAGAVERLQAACIYADPNSKPDHLPQMLTMAAVLAPNLASLRIHVGSQSLPVLHSLASLTNIKELCLMAWVFPVDNDVTGMELLIGLSSLEVGIFNLFWNCVFQLVTLMIHPP